MNLLEHEWESLCADLARLPLVRGASPSVLQAALAMCRVAFLAGAAAALSCEDRAEAAREVAEMLRTQ